MGTSHLSDINVASNLAKSIREFCETLERKPDLKAKIKTEMKRAHFNGSLGEFAIENIIGIYERMMYADRQPFPQAIEMHERLHFVKDGKLLKQEKDVQRRFKDTVRTGERTAKGQREETQSTPLNRNFERRAVDATHLVPKFFNIITKACGPDSREVKDMAERWLTLNYMLRQSNISGRERDNAAYKRVWFTTAAAFQDRVKELNRIILKKIHDDHHAALAAKRKAKVKAGAPPNTRRKSGSQNVLQPTVLALPRAQPTPITTTAVKVRRRKTRPQARLVMNDMGGRVIPFNSRARRPKNMPIPHVDPRIIRQKLIKPNSYGVMRSKLRSQMSRGGDAFAIAKQAMLDTRLPANNGRKSYGDTGTVLDGKVGLDNIKKEVMELKSAALRDAVNKKFFPDKTHEEPMSHHAIFIGVPGVGKTMTAEAIGSVLKAAGALNSGHVVKVKRQDLCAEYHGQTAPKTEAAIERAYDGVLMVEEAHSLIQDLEQKGGGYGKEAIDTIMEAMDSERDRLVVIFIFYPDQVDKFLEVNDGLQSRIMNYFEFKEYTMPQMGEIMDIMLHDRHLNLSEEARAEMLKGFATARETLGPNYGNGRFARSLVERMVKVQSHRLTQSGIISQNLLESDPSDPAIAAALEEHLFKISKEDAQTALQQAMRNTNAAMKPEKIQIGFLPNQHDAA